MHNVFITYIIFLGSLLLNIHLQYINLSESVADITKHSSLTHLGGSAAGDSAIWVAMNFHNV